MVNGILSGIIGMHRAKFLAFNALGAVLWVATWAPNLGVFDRGCRCNANASGLSHNLP
jgi:hypothetical protein